MSLKRAKENGLILHKTGLKGLEEFITKHLNVTPEVFWAHGSINISLKSCSCRVSYDSPEEFPLEDTPCDCGKNMFIKYTEK